MKSIVFTRRPVWLAWYPTRGRRCTFEATRHTRPGDPVRDGWHATVAVGPLYVGVGPGVPTP